MQIPPLGLSCLFCVYVCVQWGWVLASEVLVLLAVVWGSLSLREQLPFTVP